MVFLKDFEIAKFKTVDSTFPCILLCCGKVQIYFTLYTELPGLSERVRAVDTCPQSFYDEDGIIGCHFCDSLMCNAPLLKKRICWSGKLIDSSFYSQTHSLLSEEIHSRITQYLQQ